MKGVIAIINGPNINLTGERETGIYGADSLEGINRAIEEHARALGLECSFFQSNSEGAIIDRLHAMRHECDGVIINAGAYTHTSIALQDCIRSLKCPVIEVHISNVHKREEFRHHSMISCACLGVIAGFGLDSYRLAIEAIVKAR